MALATLAADNVAAHAKGYVASCAGLWLTLVLWIAGLAVAEGLQRQALENARAGADVWIEARALGRHAPLDPSLATRVAELAGVERVEARVIGTALAGETPVLLVGVPEASLRGASGLGEGRPPERSGQVLVGAELARELGLRPGTRLALDVESALMQVFEVSGVLDGDDALGGAKAMVVDLEDARALFGDARASSLCVWTRAGHADAVARAIERLEPGLVAITREETEAAIERARTRKSGALSGLLAPVLATATAAFAALSWLVHGRRSREIAAYKLCGFSGGDILVLTAIENALVALLLGTAAFLGAWVWVRGLGAPLLAPLLIPDLAALPAQSVPASFTPLPLVLGCALAFASTAAGSIFAAWRLSLASTQEAFA